MEDSNVFISWSGKDGEQIGGILKEWLPMLIQKINPFFTPLDINKGSLWHSEIADNLKKCKIGLICITPSSLNSDWILFEAGALSNNLDKSMVCPILFGTTSARLPGPLVPFQAAKFEEEDFFLLVKRINTSLGEQPLEEKTLRALFERLWPDLHSDIEKIMENFSGPIETEKQIGDILDEVLDITRYIADRIDMRNISLTEVAIIYRTVIRLHDSLENLSTAEEDPMNILSEIEDALSSIGEKYRGRNAQLDSLIRRASKLDYQPKEGKGELEDF